jgi:hypothetical protein
MSPLNRRPAHVLFVHKGSAFEAHVTHLIDAVHRIRMRADAPSPRGGHAQPAIIILDFEFDGDIAFRS